VSKLFEVKITRSTKSSLRFATPSKRAQLSRVLTEYGRVVNYFIDRFWVEPIEKSKLLKEIVNLPETWLSARARKVAAREALDMCASVKNRGDKTKPIHAGKRIACSSTLAELLPAKRAKGFDCWLHLASIGRNLILDLSVKLHQHFKKLAAAGRRLASYVITENYVQFAFEIETGKKLESDRCLGIDTGINALASVSTGQQFGLDIKAGIERIKRCRHGSKGQLRASRALRQRMDETAKEILDVTQATLVVTEDLKNITKNTKRRLVKSMRRSIGRWNVRYWLGTLERLCEWNRVSFRRVSPKYTSQTCSECGHIDRGNRSGELFLCLSCGHEANADVQASQNILTRFLTGPYGAGCKPINLIRNGQV
jgi:IS605 OrfB family transposase